MLGAVAVTALTSRRTPSPMIFNFWLNPAPSQKGETMDSRVLYGPDLGFYAELSQLMRRFPCRYVYDVLWLNSFHSFSSSPVLLCHKCYAFCTGSDYPHVGSLGLFLCHSILSRPCDDYGYILLLGVSTQLPQIDCTCDGMVTGGAAERRLTARTPVTAARQVRTYICSALFPSSSPSRHPPSIIAAPPAREATMSACHPRKSPGGDDTRVLNCRLIPPPRPL